MMAGTAAGWAITVIGIGLLAVLAALVFVAWWALFADRAGEHRRCPRCWYDLTYSNGLRCAECGYLGRSERDFRRTRRRPGLALLAIVGCTAIGVFIIDQGNTRGWLTYVPTRALIWSLAFFDDPRGPVHADLDRRIRGNELTDEHWLALTARCTSGDRGAAPPSDEWIAKYDFLLMTAVARMDDRPGETEDAMRALVLAIPPRVDLATRAQWPADVGATIDVAARDWWPDTIRWRIEAAPRLPGAEVDTHVLWDAPIQPRSYSLHLPPLEPGDHEVPIDLTFARRESPEDGWKTIGTQTATVALTVGAPLAEMMTPVSGESVDAMVRDAVARGVVRWANGVMPVRVSLRADPTLVEAFEGTAVGVRIEVLRNGVLGRQLDSWWLAGPAGSRGIGAWEVPFWDDAVLGAPDRPGDEWSVRVRGLPELALRVPDAGRYWAGELTATVPVSRGRGPTAPPIGWIRAEVAETLER